MELIWKSIDPRIEQTKTDILILRPNPSGSPLWEAGTGFIDTIKENIVGSFNKSMFITDEWRHDWLWAVDPRK